MGAAVWTWPSAAHPASGTPGAAGPRRRRRRGILGWRARAAPSATRLSASQSNCSEAKKGRDMWPAANLIWSMRIPSQSRLFPSTLCVCGGWGGGVVGVWGQQKKTWNWEHGSQFPSFLVLRTTLRKSAVLVKVFVLVRVTVCGQRRDWKEIWPWTLHLTGQLSE